MPNALHTVSSDDTCVRVWSRYFCHSSLRSLFTAQPTAATYTFTPPISCSRDCRTSSSTCFVFIGVLLLTLRLRSSRRGFCGRQLAIWLQGDLYAVVLLLTKDVVAARCLIKRQDVADDVVELHLARGDQRTTASRGSTIR